jgi:hypothetical protein
MNKQDLIAEHHAKSRVLLAKADRDRDRSWSMIQDHVGKLKHAGLTGKDIHSAISPLLDMHERLLQVAGHPHENVRPMAAALVAAPLDGAGWDNYNRQRRG